MLLSVVADVLQRLIDDLLDVAGLEVVVLRHDDKVEHVLQGNVLFLEFLSELSELALEPDELGLSWLLSEREDGLV